MAIQGDVFLVSGRVQGVGFRYFTEREARRIGLQGWVRNLPDGRVETAAHGTPEQMEEFLRALQKGPPLSRVDAVTRSGSMDLGSIAGFEIRR